MLLSVPGGMSMFELTVATFRPCQVPAIVFEQPDQVSYFHARIHKRFLRQPEAA